jgi:hypothetical protein
VSQLYSLVENFQSEHRKLKESRNASVGLFWREKKERKKERPQKQRDDERARERDDVCIRGVARDTKKSPHVPQQMKVRRNWTREYFSRSPLKKFFCFGKVCRGVLCLSLFLSLYYKGAAAVGRV